MKKLVSLSLIVISLSVLVNCSPKTAKTTASSQGGESPERKKQAEAIKLSIAGETEPVQDVPAVPPAPNTNKVNIPFENMSSDQQLGLFRDMAPLRIEMGKKIYSTNCNKCHAFYQPETRTAESWTNIMQKMGPAAKLNTDQYLMVAGYLVANAKK